MIERKERKKFHFCFIGFADDHLGPVSTTDIRKKKKRKKRKCIRANEQITCNMGKELIEIIGVSTSK